LGTCHAATPHRISATATTPKRILPKRRVNRNLGIRKGITRLLIRIEGHYRVLRANVGCFLRPVPKSKMPPQGHENIGFFYSSARPGR
jgi:hypothetical protein